MLGSGRKPECEDRSVCGISFELRRKKIKTIHIYVKPPDGHVLVTAPFAFSGKRIDAFVEEKADWIKKHQKRLSERPAQEKQELKYVTGDMIYVFGEPMTLVVDEDPERKRSGVEMSSDERTVTMKVPSGTDPGMREAVLDRLYKDLLEERAEHALDYWAEKTGLRFDSWHSRKMKTRWGSCNYQKRRICLNTRLAEKPPECLDYVCLHEVAHLKEHDHGPGFKALLTEYMPDWRETEKLLK